MSTSLRMLLGQQHPTDYVVMWVGAKSGVEEASRCPQATRRGAEAGRRAAELEAKDLSMCPRERSFLRSASRPALMRHG
jgi:hypothetical protein